MSENKRPFEEEIQAIETELLQDYGHGRVIDRMELFAQPDRSVIEELIEKLFRLVFPGYFRDRTYRVYNLKLLHEMMSNVLNEQPGRISIGCVFHRLAVGEKEADRMWAGVDASAFRDWMHASQAMDAYYAEARVEESHQDNEYKAVFTMPSGSTVILPDHEELPIRFYDLDTGRPRCQISEWLVELVDDKQRKVIGKIPFQKFRTLLPREKVSYYDAADSLLEPFTVDELMNLLEQAEKEYE